MLKLLSVDAPGERALRVVAYFDQLGANRPDLDAIVRATALIADCTAGLELRDRGLLLRSSPEGGQLLGSGVATEQASFATDTGEHGSVWLERTGEPLELDAFIVERFALTAALVVARSRPAGDLESANGFADPALAQLLVNERASETERSRAARLIGLPSSGSVQLIAIEPQAHEPLDALTARLRDAWQRPVFAAELSRHLALMLVVTGEPIDWDRAGPSGRAAAGPVVEVLDAPRAWAAARAALRFAGAGASWPGVLNADDLGVISLLGDLDAGAVIAHPDVVRVDRLASGPNGAESITILDHFLHADSLRSAAREVNFHHSSLQTRVGRIGSALGIDLRSASGRERAALALLLWRTFRAS